MGLPRLGGGISFCFWKYNFIVCASHTKTSVLSHMFRYRLMQAEETKHQTLLIRLGLTCYISQTENPDCLVAFPTSLPGLRITFMKGSKEYFAILHFVIRGSQIHFTMPD